MDTSLNCSSSYLQVWFQNRRAKWRRTQKANQIAMQELMNGKMMPFPGGPHHGLAAPHNAYMPMHTMNAASFAPTISPNSSVLMTPKSAGTPPSHAQLLGNKGFVLHHPTANHAPQTTIAYGQAHSAPWTAQSQFVFPSPTAMSFSNPPPLTSTACSPISANATSLPVTNHW